MKTTTFTLSSTNAELAENFAKIEMVKFFGYNPKAILSHLCASNWGESSVITDSSGNLISLVFDRLIEAKKGETWINEELRTAYRGNVNLKRFRTSIEEDQFITVVCFDKRALNAMRCTRGEESLWLLFGRYEDDNGNSFPATYIPDVRYNSYFDYKE